MGSILLFGICCFGLGLLFGPFVKDQIQKVKDKND